MKFIIHGKNIDVTEALREYVHEKLGKVERYSRHIVDINVEMSVAKNPRIKNNQQVTVTTSVNGLLLRAEESSTNMYAAIDLVADKLERQLKKYERKRSHKGSHRSPSDKTAIAMAEIEPDDEANEGHARKIRNTHFTVKPMSPEEAAAQMDLLDYNFLLFRDQDNNALKLIYRIKGKNNEFGLIVPDESVEEAEVLRV